MKMNFRLAGIALLGISMFALGGCKPTERGYKSAYDAAVGKRQAATEALETGVGDMKLQSVDGPQLRKFKEVDYYYTAENLTVLEETPAVLLNYNVAVACFKMPTNCISMVKDLQSQDIAAFGAKTADDKYYAIIGTFDNLDDAVAWYVMYDSATPKAYLGLPGAPVIIFSRASS